MSDGIDRVLFLCTGNSARSILAEALLERLGSPGVRGFSAGSHPKDQPHPAALELLRSEGHVPDSLRSKSWDEFAKPDAPRLDLVITVCDNAAGESCPIWPGEPMKLHWGLEDPAAVVGSAEEIRSAFESTYAELATRIGALVRILGSDLGEIERAAKLRAIA